MSGAGSGGRWFRALTALACGLIITGCAAGSATSGSTADPTAAVSALPSTADPVGSGQPPSAPLDVEEQATTTPPGTEPTLSDEALPTIKPPTAPPSQPSDQLTGSWVLGTVTVGGDGPCYELTADDGRVLALYSRSAGTLTTGDRLRVRVIVPLRGTADCSASSVGSGDDSSPAIEGEPMTLLETKRAT